MIDDAVLPPLDDGLLLEHLTGIEPSLLPGDSTELIRLIAARCSPEVVATLSVALKLREAAPVRLTALIVIARELLDAESPATGEIAAALAGNGWFSGVGELLAAARNLGSAVSG